MAQDEATSIAQIDLCRKINRSAAAKYVEQGVPPDDIAIAAAYSAVDLAQHFVGNDPVAAIAFVRRCLDVFEEGLPLTVETVQ
jgi:hypothetical protein